MDTFRDDVDAAAMAPEAEPPTPPEEPTLTDEQARQLARRLELHQAVTSGQPGFTDPFGTGPINETWASLSGGYEYVGRLDTVIPMLADIQGNRRSKRGHEPCWPASTGRRRSR